MKEKRLKINKETRKDESDKRHKQIIMLANEIKTETRNFSDQTISWLSAIALSTTRDKLLAYLLLKFQKQSRPLFQI